MLTVTIYTTGAGCGECHMTKTALKAKGIPFTEVDITKPENADAREYVTEDLGYSTAPWWSSKTVPVRTTGAASCPTRWSA